MLRVSCTNSPQYLVERECSVAREDLTQGKGELRGFGRKRVPARIRVRSLRDLKDGGVTQTGEHDQDDAAPACGASPAYVASRLIWQLPS